MREWRDGKQLNIESETAMCENTYCIESDSNTKVLGEMDRTNLGVSRKLAMAVAKQLSEQNPTTPYYVFENRNRLGEVIRYYGGRIMQKL